MAAENDGKTVAVFSHGAAMRMVLGTLNGLSLADVGETPHGDNTAGPPCWRSTAMIPGGL